VCGVCVGVCAMCMYMGGAHKNLVWVAQAASATPSTLNTTGRDILQEQERTGRGPIMEDGGMVCAMALRSANGWQTTAH
jgi:hypothetical protein